MKKKYSPHLSIKRLSELSLKYTEEHLTGNEVKRRALFYQLSAFLNFVEKSRPSLGGKLPLGKGKKI